jgi:hypothetical protein
MGGSLVNVEIVITVAVFVTSILPFIVPLDEKVN